MSSTNSNYMDGVPIKLNEKYKLPPKVTIPQEVVNRLSTITEEYYESPEFTYSFQLEKQVIKKLQEWQKVREIECENRRERIRKYELQKCRDIEARQKELLGAVSYPNAEDLSSDSSEEEDEESKNEECKTVALVEPNSHHLRQCYDTILQPTVASSTSIPSTVFIPSKINYSDFENDTSSPFDNIELKTINDLDILAQVLNDTQRHSAENNAPAVQLEEEDHQAQDTDSKLAPKESSSIVNTSPVVVNEEAASVDANETPTTSSNQNQIGSNFYYTNSSVIPNNYHMMVQQTQALHLHQQQQQQHHPHHPHQQQYMMNYANTTINHHNVKPCSADLYFNYNALPEVSNHNYLYGNYPQQLQDSTATTAATISQNVKYNNYPNGTFLNSYCDSQYGVRSDDVVNSGNRLEADVIPKSKSKSVPDILKELKDEIRDSEIRRTRNHSQTIDDQIKRNSADSAQTLSSPQPPSRSTPSSSTSFMKLSPSSQKLAKNISSMGFPLERVSKIAELYGTDDKKIIEHLIPLSELLDLGFDESKISEALVKFDNNKDKALDFLIS